MSNRVRVFAPLLAVAVGVVVFGPPGSAWASNVRAESHTGVATGVHVTTTPWPSTYGSLSGIAGKVCGDAGKWRGIASANGITRPKLLPVGRRLWVPCARGAAAPKPKPATSAGGVRQWVAPLWPGAATSSCFGPRAYWYHGVLVRDTHGGIDMPAPAGTAVKAIGAGKVARAGWRGGYGNAVEIRHANGIASIYAHLSRVNVHTGQTVRAGTVVGRVGSSGQSTGPHLHLELRRNGSAFGAGSWLRARGVRIGC